MFVYMYVYMYMCVYLPLSYPAASSCMGITGRMKREDTKCSSPQKTCPIDDIEGLIGSSYIEKEGLIG
jgi:hypothetical protein